jgi:hypothetical protein
MLSYLETSVAARLTADLAAWLSCSLSELEG